MDAKDILGLPNTPLPLPQEKKSRLHKDSQRKPDGISREVYAHTGGLAPLMPLKDVAQLKRRAQAENGRKQILSLMSEVPSNKKTPRKLGHCSLH
ncbi:SWR1-complex protein 4-like [Actinidia eriantha]|uniref:SWR1-complex protein 4-like n=1 Tax=Actinidia eriantha TaxID=165200 RepID=UPI00258CAA0A|nr:SWR1-complex protein 4-like [Actinidia eriantha]